MSDRKRKRNAILEAISRVRGLASELNLTELQAFLYIAERPGLNIGELAELCGIQSSSASRIVRSLASDETDPTLPRDLGLIELLPNPFDARVRFLVLSDRGIELCHSLDAVIEQSVSIRTPTEKFKSDLRDLVVNAERMGARP